MSDDTPLNGTSDDDIIADAYARFKRCRDWESTARTNMAADKRFAEGDSRNNYHWPESIAKDRQAQSKPILTNNMVRQHNLQIVNDARQHKAGIEVRPAGDNATYEAAKVFEGLIRHIETQSDAETAYDTATYHQVYAGIGYFRIVTEYLDDESFDQEIFIRRIADPGTVYLDPDIKHYDGSDARFGFVFDDMERREFNRRYPGHDDIGETPKFLELDGDQWLNKDTIRRAEFYRKVAHTDWITELPENVMPSQPEGGVIRDSEVPQDIRDLFKALGLRRRKVTASTIEHFHIAGDRVIQRSVWPGTYIPIVRVVGEETVIDGVLDRKGHTRAMISAQQMHNYFYSAAVEHVALQTKSPYLTDIRAIEGYEDYWRNANTSNYAYLPYNSIDDAGQPIQRPERVDPPGMAAAFVQGLQISSQLIMDVSGQHQANLGEPSNEKSGVAIQQRQRQGDNATAHYIDHQAQAIRFAGRILIDLIPRIYDTPRVIQILEPDGSRYKVQVDTGHNEPHTQVQDQDSDDYDEKAIVAIFNPSMGRYGVVADIGPSFATKRQDAFNAMTQLMQGNQQLMQAAGDLLFRNADFPGADDIAERLQRAIPPALLGQGPPPQVQQLQQHLQVTQQQAHQLLGKADADMAALKAENEKLKADLAGKTDRTDLESYRAETERMAAVAKVDPDALKPLIRELVSQALQQPAVPVIQAHQTEDAMHGAMLDAASQQMQPVDPAQTTPAVPGAQTGPV